VIEAAAARLAQEKSRWYDDQIKAQELTEKQRLEYEKSLVRRAARRRQQRQEWKESFEQQMEAAEERKAEDKAYRSSNGYTEGSALPNMGLKKRFATDLSRTASMYQQPQKLPPLLSAKEATSKGISVTGADWANEYMLRQSIKDVHKRGISQGLAKAVAEQEEQQQVELQSKRDHEAKVVADLREELMREAAMKRSHAERVRAVLGKAWDLDSRTRADVAEQQRSAIARLVQTRGDVEKQALLELKAETEAAGIRVGKRVNDANA
jgi:hypothetical protein